jgi:hypothetical protein
MKSPPMNSWQHAASTDAKKHRGWWAGLYQGHGIGIATGPESGVIALDVDDHGSGDGFARLAELEAEYGSLPSTVTSITPTGSQHRFFKYPQGATITGFAGTKLGVGIDVRANGGQVLAAPTLHAHKVCVLCNPKDGVRPLRPCPQGDYRFAPGLGPTESVVADLPPAWVELLATREAPASSYEPVLHGVGLGAPYVVVEDSIAAHVVATHRVVDVLILDGWRLGAPKGNGDIYVTRPGKGSGTSGVLHANGVLTVWTTSVAALAVFGSPTRDGGGRCGNVWHYLVATRFNGDASAAARQYRADLTADQSRYVTMSTSRSAVSVLDGGEFVSVDDDWASLDLVGLYEQMTSGEYRPTVPTVLAVEGGVPLFYPGRINSLIGESGSGKTWIALAAVMEVANSGGRVLMLDWEDSPSGTIERLMLLGVGVDGLCCIDYRNPSTSLLMGIQSGSMDGDYALVVLDSTGESMAAGGINSNADDEVATWFVALKQWARRLGDPVVLMLDHIPKAKDDSPTMFAIGSQRKRAAINGASYRVDAKIEPARGKDGLLRVTVAKDRPGNRARSTVACDVAVVSTAGSVLITPRLSEMQAAAVSGEKRRPTALMERVSRYVEDNPGASSRSICRDCSGRAEHLRWATDVLVEEGFLTLSPSSGRGGGMAHHSANPFRDDAENGTASNRVQPRPTASRDAVQTDLSEPRPTASLPLYTGAGRGRGSGGLKDGESDEKSRTAAIDDDTLEIF